jgi:hypothetical protein
MSAAPGAADAFHFAKNRVGARAVGVVKRVCNASANSQMRAEEAFVPEMVHGGFFGLNGTCLDGRIYTNSMVEG